VAGEWNLFSIGRRRGYEDQLTEMLAWLASHVPPVATALVQLAVGGSEEEDLADVEVDTQVWIAGGRLDLVLKGRRFLVVVESKLGSDYGPDQLPKYLTWLAERPGDYDTLALMTLTEKVARWPPPALERASEVGIAPCERRWEELHDLLEPLADGPDSSLEGRLVREFLEMLTEEGLIPMKPLTGSELGTAWSESRTVVRRYHEFFRACQSAIADALGATPVSNSKSEHFDYIWQDFLRADGTRLVVGIWYTDEGVPIKPPVYTGAPIVWMAAQVKEWPEAADAECWLEEHPPAGWLARGKRWWERPEVWCYLSDAVGEGTFDEQRERLARRCGEGAAWVEAARTGGAAA